MTFRLILASGSVLLASVCPPSMAAAVKTPKQVNADVATTSVVRTVDRLIDSSVKKWGTPGTAVSITRHGEVVLSKGYGVRDPRTNAPVTADTIFPIASLVKAFTSLGVGILVDEGKLSFDGLARTYVPEFAVNDLVATGEITIRDLLSHRSGLRRRHDFMYFRNPAMTPAEFVERLSHLDLHARPRQTYEYSNGAYVLVGQAIENASGVTYERFMEERIFQPLDMRRTFYSTSKAKSDPNHAMGRWFWKGKPVYEYYDFGRIINPHGGISTTANDMAKWMLLNLSEGSANGVQIIQSPTLREIQSTQIPAVTWNRDEFIPLGSAMGWETMVFRGELILHHNGGVPGFHSVTILIPSKKIGLTILANESSELMSLLPLEILDHLLGAEHIDRLNPALSVRQTKQREQLGAEKEAVLPPSAPPARALADYAGTYVHRGYGAVSVRHEGGRLVAEYNGYSAPLVHRNYDVFVGSPVDPASELFQSHIQFRADSTGRIEQLTWETYEDEVFDRHPIEAGTHQATPQ